MGRPSRMKATASISVSATAALGIAVKLFWSALWSLMRHPRSRPGVTFYLLED